VASGMPDAADWAPGSAQTKHPDAPALSMHRADPIVGTGVGSLVEVSMVSGVHDPSPALVFAPRDPLTPPPDFRFGDVQVGARAGRGRPGRPSGDPDWRDVT
jgi:hypothetical protein